MHLARVLEAVEAHKADAVPQAGLADPAQHRFPALVRLDQDEDDPEAGEVMSVPALVPQTSTGQADGVGAVVPQRVAVAFALDNDDGRLWSEPPQAVEQGLGAALPAKAVVPDFGLYQGRTKANGRLCAAQVPIWDPQGRRALVEDVRKAKLLQEGLRHTLQLRIGGERASGLLQCCR